MCLRGPGWLACIFVLVVMASTACSQGVPGRPGFTSHFPSTITYASLNQVQIPQDDREWQFEVTHLDMAHGLGHLAGIKRRAPSFFYVKYQLMETGLIGVEEKQIELVCSKKALDPENAYLHYSDDTLLRLEGREIMVPGWGRGNAKVRRDARVKAELGGTLRYVYNWGDSCTHEYMTDRSIRDLTEPVEGQRFNGIFIDEMAAPDIPTASPLPTPIEAGHVVEFGGRTRQEIARSGDYERAVMSLFSDVSRALKGTTHGQSLFYPNTGSYTTDGVLRLGIAADGILTEGLSNEDAQYSRRGEAYLWDFAKSLAAKGKIFIFVQRSHAPPTTRGFMPSNYRSLQDRHEMYSLTSYWMARQGDWVYYSEAPIWQPLSRFWIRAQEFDLGKPMGDPYVWREDLRGDAAGQKYRVHRRDYSKGIVLFRTRFDWDDSNFKNFGSPSETYKLDGMYRVLYPDGTLGRPIDRIALCLSEGVALVPSEAP